MHFYKIKNNTVQLLLVKIKKLLIKILIKKFLLQTFLFFLCTIGIMILFIFNVALFLYLPKHVHVTCRHVIIINYILL